MATVDKSLADQLVLMNGQFSDDPQVTHIIEYDNAFGGTSYGIVYIHESPSRYAASEFVRNPRLYWSLRS